MNYTENFSTEEEIRRSPEEIEAAARSVDSIKAEYEQKILKIEEEKAALESSLAQAREKIVKLQTGSAADKNDDSEYLMRFDDTDTSLLPSGGSDEIVSLCCIGLDYKGRKCPIRYADLSCNGHYDIFVKNKNASAHFANRDKIYCKDDSFDIGFYGIWNWTAVQDKNDPIRERVLSRYNEAIDAIEVVIIKEASSLDELVDMIKRGIDYKPHSNKTMFSVCKSEEEYIGILCGRKELITDDGKTFFNENCNEAAVYEFSSGDIMYLGKKRHPFYKNAFAGIPCRIYQVKKPLEIVKDMVLSSISWSEYEERGFIYTEYESFKDFLDAIPIDDIMSRIAVQRRCSDSEAGELLNEFLNTAWKYVDGDSVEDKIILSAISANDELKEKTKALIRADWEEENKRLIDEAQGKIDLLEHEISAADARLNEARDALNKTKSEEEHLSRIIAEKEKLAEDVEKAVAEKIQSARENAADFIANMAFVNRESTQSAAAEISDEVEAEMPQYYVFPALEKLGALEANHTWSDVIDTAAYELGEAGVSERYKRSLAAFLCAAYIKKQPLLIVGPNAADIIQAFGAATVAHKCGALFCEGCYTNRIITQIGAEDEEIVIINNLISGGWMNRLPEILSQKDIFYAAVHPYAEDIQVEPKSLYGFMLPLFTEFFVDKKASGKYFGGYFADDFKNYSAQKGARKNSKILSKLSLSSLVKNQINALIGVMHEIYPNTTADDEFLYAVLPIAHASLKVDELTEAMADLPSGEGISENLKREMKYVLGEI
ncbi:MAG: hypothetical protein LUG52_10445 [Clostridia bacterium]|nr:hypothetical protein [Clostridia bacterium]